MSIGTGRKVVLIESELGTAQREHPAEMGMFYDPPGVPKGPSDWL